ncbi:MAG: VOC family protein [Limibacillus sp.]|jgi:lactoylglutathione lyase
MQYLHTMIRVSDIDESLDFFCNKLGLEEVRRYDNDKGRFTLIFLAAPEDVEKVKKEEAPAIELTYNWDPEEYSGGRNFGHLAYRVENIYETCQRLMDSGVTINRPPRDGRMAFVRSPDNISIELLQRGDSLPQQEPWASMPNTGEW